MDTHPKIASGPASTSFSRRFLSLVALGLIGVASLPLVMLPTLRFLVRNGQAPGMSIETLVALSLIQPALLLIAGAAAGATLAPSLGLASHVAKVNTRGPFVREVPLAVVTGLMAGLVIVGLDLALFRHTAPASVTMSTRAIVDGLLGGVLYGGLSEEIMMRWGLMSFVAWAGVRLFARGAGRPRAGIFVASIVLVALLFAAGHLPAVAMVGELSAGIIGRILLLNAVAGLLFGWLFWRRSLEAAMLAHASVHVVFAVAQAVGWG
jgi:CAAX prenyl protease-like protein